MKAFCLFCFLVLGVFSVSMAQNAREEKNVAVKVLIASSEKNKCLLQLDKQLYLVAVSDIQLIGKEKIASIQMYMPGMNEFTSIASKAGMTNEKIVCAVEVYTKPGTKLPRKFMTEQK